MRKKGLLYSSAYGATKSDSMHAIADAGFQCIMTNEVTQEQARCLAALAKESGLEYHMIHAPFDGINSIWLPGEKGDAMLARLLSCVDIASDSEVPYVVVHLSSGENPPCISDCGHERFDALVRRAEKRGVVIAFENQRLLANLAFVMELYEHNPFVGFCWDTGHEMCYNRSKDMLSLYGDKLIATHLNDNLGIRDFDGNITWIDDLHLLPFDGIADWQGIADRLDNCGYDGILTFELNRYSKPNRHENDFYREMPIEKYLTLAYMRACRVASLRKAEQTV